MGRRHSMAGPIGESWEIVDRPEAQSIVASGPHAGRTLRELISGRSEEIMGPGWNPERRFPILVKWLDCRERLSLQVHPPAEVAGNLGGEPKTENWYFARVDPGASVFAGLKPGISPSDFRQAIEEGTVEGCMRKLAVAEGDSLLIKSGVMHAIDGGNVILEIQQNSDTTYRVYDWGRVGLDGKPRALHVRESMECLEASIGLGVPQLAGEGGGACVLAQCAEFTIRRIKLASGGRLALRGGEQPRILSVVAGSVRDVGGAEVGLRLGDNCLVSWGHECVLEAAGESALLVTEGFAGSRS